MKLVQINSVYNTGSTGRIVEGIAAAARARGHETWAAYGRSAQPGPTETYRVSRPMANLVHGVRSFLFDAHGLGSYRSTRKLIDWLKKVRPDVVGLHNVHGYYLHVPELFRGVRRLNIPVVWTLHDCWPFTGHCSYFDRFNCDRWVEGCHDCPMTSFYPRSLIDRSSHNWKWKKDLLNDLPGLTIVTPSNWLQGLVETSFLGRHPVRVINNGIDLQVFRPRSCYGGKIVLGVANNWDSRKGLADFKELRNHLPLDWIIRLVGLTRAQAEALPSGIEGIERTEGVGELAEIYSEATVFANPTYSDNFPTTNLEALACGTPVVTYRTGGSPEAVNEATGRVVDQGDVGALASAVLEIGSKPREVWRERCRQHAAVNFSATERFSEYIELVEEICLDRVAPST